jgi:hypothetical protein
MTDKENPINLKHCETFCNQTQVYPAMKHLIEDKGMSQRKASDTVAELTKGKVTSSRARHVYHTRTPTDEVARTGHPNNTEEKEEPLPLEAEAIVDYFIEAVLKDKCEDDKLKQALDTVSRKVAVGKVSTKVTSNIAAVHDSKTKRRDSKKEKPKKSLIVKVTEAFTMMQYNLEAVLAKGTKSITKGERKMITTAFMHGLPNFLRTLIWMGIDLDEALKRARAQHKKELENGKNRKNNPRLEK